MYLHLQEKSAAICSCSQGKLDRVKNEFCRKSYELYTESVYASDSAKLYAFTGHVHEEFGRIDIWINKTAQTIVKSFLPEVVLYRDSGSRTHSRGRGRSAKNFALNRQRVTLHKLHLT